jgi:hypothetical protein
MHCTLIAFVVGEDLDQALTLEYLLGPIVPLISSWNFQISKTLHTLSVYETYRQGRNMLRSFSATQSPKQLFYLSTIQRSTYFGKMEVYEDVRKGKLPENNSASRRMKSRVRLVGCALCWNLTARVKVPAKTLCPN